MPLRLSQKYNINFLDFNTEKELKLECSKLKYLGDPKYDDRYANECLCTEIRRAYEKFLTPLAKQIDMPVKAVGILLYIANNPLANTAKDICRNLFMKQGIVSFHVDNLVKAGLS